MRFDLTNVKEVRETADPLVVHELLSTEKWFVINTVKGIDKEGKENVLFALGRITERGRVQKAHMPPPTFCKGRELPC